MLCCDDALGSLSTGCGMDFFLWPSALTACGRQESREWDCGSQGARPGHPIRSVRASLSHLVSLGLGWSYRTSTCTRPLGIWALRPLPDQLFAAGTQGCFHWPSQVELITSTFVPP